MQDGFAVLLSFAAKLREVGAKHTAGSFSAAATQDGQTQVRLDECRLYVCSPTAHLQPSSERRFICVVLQNYHEMSSEASADDERAWRELFSACQAVTSVEVRTICGSRWVDRWCSCCLILMLLLSFFRAATVELQGMYIAAISSPVAAQTKMMKELAQACDSSAMLAELAALPFADVTVVRKGVWLSRDCDVLVLPRGAVVLMSVIDHAW